VFPNSYGSLGYATRLRIELQPVSRGVSLRNLRFDNLDELTAVIDGVMATGSFDGVAVDVMDGVMFTPQESVLVLGQFVDTPDPASDYTGQDVYYRSLTRRHHDLLSTYDYVWRWDTDWFWCSRAFGAQHPVVRRMWPRRYRRSDVYHRLLRLEYRYDVAARVAKLRGEPPRERVVQDVEIPLDHLPQFLRWFADTVRMSPVWLCPVRLRESHGPGSARTWPLYPMEPGRPYVNVGFWGTVPISAGAEDGDVNRAIERAVLDAGGHKGLYSDAYYDRSTFDRLYGGSSYRVVKDRYDPGNRLTDLYDKAVRRR
jgi:FAD/FMN-containing dehydrogenase